MPAGDHYQGGPRTVVPPSEIPLAQAERCGAHVKRHDKGCQKRKGWGTDHIGFGNCKNHGGSTVAGKKAAAREMGHKFMSNYKAQFRFGGNRSDPAFADMTPETALLEEVRRSAAMVRFLEERIALWNLSEAANATIVKFAELSKTSGDELRVLQQDALNFLRQAADSPDLPELTQVHRATGVSSYTDAREWLMLYREERGHLARVSKMAIDAGVANRLVTLAEDQGRLLSQALRAILTALDLSLEQEALLPKIIPPVLRAVATDQPIPNITSLLTPSLPEPEPIEV